MWIERRGYYRCYYRHNLCIFLRHHHRHCILLLLCSLPVLPPLSYTRCFGRQPTALSTVRLNSYTHDNNAASTSSSAGQLQSASSRFQPGSSALLNLSSAIKPESSTARTNSSGTDACCSNRANEQVLSKVICEITSPSGTLCDGCLLLSELTNRPSTKPFNEITSLML